MSKPFSLEKALAGEPIEFKGYKCYLHARRSRENAYIVESATSHTIWNPVYLEELNQNGMWEEPRPRVQLDLPCPLKKWRRNCYTITNDLSVEKTVHIERPFDEDLHFYFATEKDAQEWIDAMRDSRR